MAELDLVMALEQQQRLPGQSAQDAGIGIYP